MKIGIKTASQKETKRLAKEILAWLVKRKKRETLIFALKGELGSGKTTFVEGASKVLGLNNKISSPTFVIFRKLKINNFPDWKNFYHFDCYRIENSKELINLGFQEIKRSPKSIIFIEWPEKIRSILPSHTIWIYFEFGKKERDRIIIIEGLRKKGEMLKYLKGKGFKIAILK